MPARSQDDFVLRPKGGILHRCNGRLIVQDLRPMEGEGARQAVQVLVDLHVAAVHQPEAPLGGNNQGPKGGRPIINQAETAQVQPASRS